MDPHQYSSGSEEDINSMLNSKLFIVLRQKNGEETIIDEIETCLLDGADINAQNQRGNTILHLAAKKGYQQVEKYLLSVPGIRKDIKNLDGRTAVELAEPGYLKHSSNKSNQTKMDHGESGINVDEGFKQPLSTNLTVDKDLHIGNKLFANLLMACNNSSRSKAETLKLEPFPASKIMALFALLVYCEKGNKSDAEYEKSIELPEGWTLLTTASNTNKLNGYFGAAFLNSSLQQVVVAHRGTVPGNPGSWWTNFIGIVWNKNAPRMNSAVTFTDIICKALSDTNKISYRRFHLSLTGHSMGGWLAQVSAFSAKYTMKDGKRFVKLKNGQGFLAHTVVFDNPGCNEMMTKLRESAEFRYDSSIVLDRLDITCYLSAPNRINGCNMHLGAIYRVITDLTDMSYYQKKTPLYNLATHDMQKMLNAFEGTPIIEQVSNWPRSGALRQGPEHKKFFHRANHRNNYHPQSKEGEQYADYYITTPFDSKVCNLRVFSQQEQSLLETWSTLRTSKFKLNLLDELAVEFGFNHFDDLLPPSITIDKENNTLTCDNKESLNNVIRHTKQLIRWFFQNVNEATKAQVAAVPTAVESLFRGTSQNYLISLPQSQVAFLDSLGLKDFLLSDFRILFIHTDDTEFQVTKLYNISKQIKEDKNNQADQCLQKYLEDKCQTFLELSQLQELAKLVNIESILKSDTFFDNLLVIEYKPEGDYDISYSDSKFLDSVWSKLEEAKGKKIVLISSNKIKLPMGIATERSAVGLNIADLTVEAQKTLLEKNTISLQGTEISLAELVGIHNFGNASSIKTFNGLIDCNKQKQFITATGIVLDIGKELSTLSDLEVAYTTPVNKVTSLQQLCMHFSNVDESESRRPYFVISGVSRESRASEPGWREVLDVGSNKVEIKWIPKYSEDGAQLFKELIRQDSNRVVNWLHSTAGLLRWQQIYDAGFYIQRQFIRRVIIDNTKIPNFKNNHDLFVFQYSKDKKSLMQSINITNEKDFFKNFNIISSDDQYDAIIKNNNGRNIHFFTVEERKENGCIVWRRSVGSLKDLRSCVIHDVREAVGEEQLCDGSRKLVILADEPGMGKTTSLTRVSGLIKSSWIIRIDLKHFQQPISKLSFDVTMHHAVEFLLTESTSGDVAERKLLQYCLETNTSRQVYILFDGFDEIQEIHSGEILKKCAQEKVVRLLRFLKDNTTANILVTTRKYPSYLLENELSVFTTKFKKIDKEQQIAFLKRFWRSHLNLHPGSADDTLQKYAISWNLQAALILGEDIASFMGIPLQMRMMAEVSLEQTRLCVERADHRDIALPFRNVFDLYDIFIKSKYDIYLKDKSGLSAGLNSVNRGWFERDLTKMHRALAFRQLFPDLATRFLGTELTDEDIVELNRVGLIQSGGDGTVEFTHRTFAEYFTAELLVHWLGKSRGRHHKYPSTEEILLFKVLLEADYKVCRQFIDDQLRKSSSVLWNNPSLVGNLWSKNKKQFFNSDYQTALHVAVQETRESILSYLLGIFYKNTSIEKYISFVTAHDLNGDTALALAAKNESIAYIDKLLMHVNNDLQKNIILSTVFKSSKNRDVTCPHIDFLIKFSLRTNGCWKLETSFLEKRYALIKSVLNAAESGNLPDIQKALDKAESSTDLRLLLAAADGKGATALHIAVKSARFFDIVQYLIEKHAVIDAIDCEAMTPLLHAVKTSNLKIVKYLISCGADFMHRDRYNMTALAWAAKSNQLDIVQHLFNLNADFLKISDVNRITPFQHAAKEGHIKVVEFLFEKGADINGQDKFGMSALSWAARGKWMAVLEFLLEKKADINQRDRYERSSLQIAIKANSWKVR